MDFGELLLIALVSLALLGGNIKIEFKGLRRRAADEELKDGERKLLNK